MQRPLEIAARGNIRQHIVRTRAANYFPQGVRDHYVCKLLANLQEAAQNPLTTLVRNDFWQVSRFGKNLRELLRLFKRNNVLAHDQLGTRSQQIDCSGLVAASSFIGAIG